MTDTDPATINPELTATLQQHIPVVLAGITRKINVAQLLATSGKIGDIEIDKIVVGTAHIGRLTLQGTSLDVRSGSAFLKNVRTVLELQFNLDWWYDIGISSDSGTDDLGSLLFG